MCRPPVLEKNITDVVNKRKRLYIALSGSMVALGSASLGYTLFGFINGFSFVIMIFGGMWYIQTQLESALDTIEIKVRQE